MEEGAKALVVVAGTNDILQQSRDGKTPNEVMIAEDIINIRRQAKNMRVECIYISSIIVI